LILFLIFFHNAPNATWITTSFNCRYLSMLCTHPIDGCPPFMLCPQQWAHEHPWCSLQHFCCHYIRCQLPCEKKTTTCALTAFHSFGQWVDILLIKNEIRTLVDVVIVDLTQADLLCQSYVIWEYVDLEATQAKEGSYHDRHLINHFFFLSSWGVCMSKQISWCVLTWLCQCHVKLQKAKRPSSFFFLITFCYKKISITLQKMQASSILCQVVVINLAISQLPPLQDAPHHHDWPLINKTEILTSSLC
jgi:hypothetical protein